MTASFPARLALCCATLFLLQATSRALDLTPHPDSIHGNEGPATPAIQVSDGSKKILFVAPHDWLPEGGGKSLSLTGPGAGGAWMKLLVVTKQNPPAAPLDPSAKPEDLQAWAQQYIPGGAQDVAFVKSVESPFTVCTHPSTEFVFTFSRYGARGTISISSVDFNDTEQLVVIFSAEPKDFEKVRAAVIASMFSWHYK